MATNNEKTRAPGASRDAGQPGRPSGSPGVAAGCDERSRSPQERALREMLSRQLGRRGMSAPWIGLRTRPLEAKRLAGLVVGAFAPQPAIGDRGQGLWPVVIVIDEANGRAHVVLNGVARSNFAERAPGGPMRQLVAESCARSTSRVRRWRVLRDWAATVPAAGSS